MNIASNGTAHKLGFSEVGITDGLVGWWPLNGNANDFSGNSNHGSVSGATVSSGLDQLCYSFDGVNDYIGCGNFGSFLPIGTISFWMNADIVENYRNPFHTKFEGVNNGIRFEESSTGQFSATLGNDAGTYGSYYYLSSGMASNTWYYVVLIWDVAANSVKGYLDGNSRFNTTNTYWATTMPSITVGGGFDSSRYWKGKIQDVRIYNRALSADEVNILYELGNSTTKTKISKNTAFIKGEFNELL